MSGQTPARISAGLGGSSPSLSMSERAMIYAMLGRLVEAAWGDAATATDHAGESDVSPERLLQGLKRNILHPDGACARLRPVLESALRGGDDFAQGPPDAADVEYAMRDFDACREALACDQERDLRAALSAAAMARAGGNNNTQISCSEDSSLPSSPVHEDGDGRRPSLAPCACPLCESTRVCELAYATWVPHGAVECAMANAVRSAGAML